MKTPELVDECIIVIPGQSVIAANLPTLYSEKTLALALLVAIASAMIFGIFVGVLISQKCCANTTLTTSVNNNNDTPFSVKVTRKDGGKLADFHRR